MQLHLIPGPCSYEWLPHTQLPRIPVRGLAAAGGLVAVWVTNNSRYLDYVCDVLFPKWGVAHVASWYWLKVKD
jgi:N6-adenosine-specific RNA methylase IME4